MFVWSEEDASEKEEVDEDEVQNEAVHRGKSVAVGCAQGDPDGWMDELMDGWLDG